MRYCLGEPTSYGNLWAALAFMPFGLFFDFMDGKVARWRKKSSLMGQELDSLADLVCFAYVSTLSVLHAVQGTWIVLTSFTLDLFWSISSSRRFRNWPPHPSRPSYSYILRPLRAHSSCPLQYLCCQRPQGCHRQVEIFRRHTNPYQSEHRRLDGLLGQ